MDVEAIYAVCGAITNISYVPIFALMLLSGAYRQYRAFTGFVFLMALWGYADYLMGLTDDYMPLWRGFNFCNILNAFLFYIFSNEFTRKYNIRTIIISGVLCLFFLFLNYYNNILMPDAFLELTGIELMKEIIWYDLFIVYYCTLLIMGTYWIYKNYDGNKTIRKLILIACICTIIGDTYSYATVYFESLYNQPYWAYIICVLPYCVTYLVLRYRLFDARSVFLRMMRWVFIIVSSFLIVGLLYWALTYYFHHTIIFNLDLIVLVAVFIIILAIFTKSHTIRSWFELSDLVRLERAVQDFLLASSVYESNSALKESILTTLQSGLQIDTIQLLGPEKLSKYPEITKVLAYAPKKSILLSLKEAQTEEHRDNQAAPYQVELASLGELCVPIYVEKKLAYIVVLPEKNSQAAYSENEKIIIISMRPKIALSLQILEYNKSLRDEVARQTRQISKQKKELELSYGKLEALDKEKDVFMNMAAHELRTPMTIMRGYADIMLDSSGGELNPMQKKLTENILKGSESLIALVNDLLNLSRIDAGKMELVYAPCEIKLLAQGIFANFQTLMAQKHMEFVLEDTTDETQIFTTDQTKLTLIFNNLLSNAYKYTHESGKVTWSLKTVIENKKPWLEFSVTDSGVGIPEAELPTVFNRFANISTHNKIAATIQSTGLGLSIVKKIANGLQGTISVKSVVDQGTTFTVRLPYAPEVDPVKSTAKKST